MKPESRRSTLSSRASSGYANRMRIHLSHAVVRSWRSDDAASLARHANNRNIWKNLRDAFPHPYGIEDARRFLERAAKMDPETYFCIAVDDLAGGGIGFNLGSDVERFSAEIGYWLGEELWGRGITTEALIAVTRHAIEKHGLHRVFAVPYAWNAASARILEKAGYVLEGVMRKSAFKDGQVVDQLLYAFVP
jgi:RimJ/RimL family protein N-acetyltransferase